MPAAMTEGPTVALSFANNFWGKDDAGVGPMLERMHGAKQTCDELRSFYNARASIEDEYARRLLSLCRKSLGSQEMGTLKTSLDTVRGEVEAMAKQHQNNAAQMKSELEEPLAAFAGGMKERRKIVQNGIEKLLKVKVQQTQQVNKTRDRYEQECLKIKGYLAQGHMVMGQEERKNKAKLEKTQISLATSNTEYENAVKALEETTARWNREWKAAADKFQDLEEERLDFTKSSLWTFANIASTVCVSDDASCEKIRLSLEKMEVEKDIVHFIKERGTGQEIPDPPKYINFCRGDVDSASEVSEDDSYSVAQFPRSINPAFRTSSPQPSTYESHHDPNSALARDLGHGDPMTPPSREQTLTPQKVMPPPVSEPRQRSREVPRDMPQQMQRDMMPPQVSAPPERARQMPRETSREVQREVASEMPHLSPREIQRDRMSREVPRQAPSERTSREFPRETQMDIMPLEMPQGLRQRDVTTRQMPQEPQRDVIPREAPRAAQRDIRPREIHQEAPREIIRREVPRETPRDLIPRKMPQQARSDIWSREVPRQAPSDRMSREMPRQAPSGRLSREVSRETQGDTVSRKMSGESQMDVMPLDMPREAQRDVMPPPVSTPRERSRQMPSDGYKPQIPNETQFDPNDFAPVPHDPYPMDGMTMLCRPNTRTNSDMGSQLSSQSESQRPMSRDETSDISNPTSFSSQEPPSGKVSPVKQEPVVQPASPAADSKKVLKKKSGFFQNHSPFRRKSAKDVAQNHRNTWHFRNDFNSNRSPLYGGEDTAQSLLADRKTASPDPIDANANVAINVGDNVLPVTLPGRQKKQEPEPQEEDPIAQALAELKGVTVGKQSSVRMSADHYHGISTPAPGEQQSFSRSVPPVTGGNTISAAMRGTPPPSYTQPVTRLGVPSPAVTSRAMKETSQKYTQQTRNLFSADRAGTGGFGSPSRPGTRGSDMPRAASPAPPRSASPRPSVKAETPRQAPRSASPNPYAGSHRGSVSSQRSQRPGSVQMDNSTPTRSPGQGFYRQASPASDLPRAASPSPFRGADFSRPSSRGDFGRPASRPGSSYGQAADNMSVNNSPTDDGYGSVRGRNGRPGTAQSQGYKGISLYEPPGAVAPAARQRSKSVADGGRQYTRDGRLILHFARALYMYQAAIPEELGFQKGDTLAVLRHQDDGWWEAEIYGGNGQSGLVPSNYLQPI